MASSVGGFRRTVGVLAAGPLTFLQLSVLLFAYALRSSLLWRLSANIGAFRSGLLHGPRRVGSVADQGPVVASPPGDRPRRLTVVAVFTIVLIGLLVFVGVKISGSGGSASDLVDSTGTQIHVGDCLDAATPLTTVELTVVDCATAHEAEVTAIAKVSSQPFPSDSVADALATTCSQKMQSMEYPESPEGTVFADSLFVSPQSQWDSGNRELVCAATLYTTPDNGATREHPIAVTGSIADGTTNYESGGSDGPTPTPADTGDVPSFMVGSWNGTVDQKAGSSYDDKTAESYQASITLTGGSVGDEIGTSNYPSLGCSGTLRLDSTDGTATLNVTETITEDPNNTCQPEVQIEIANTEGGLSYAGYDKDGNYFGGLLVGQ